jgi:hypothetical protein
MELSCQEISTSNNVSLFSMLPEKYLSGMFVSLKIIPEETE